MRTGTAISVVFHVTLVAVGVFLSGVRLFDPSVAEAITVDLVSPDEAPQPPMKEELKTPETPPLDIPASFEKPEKPAEKSAPQSQPKSQQAAAPAPASRPVSPASTAPPQPVERPPPQAAPIPYPEITRTFAKLAAESNGDFDAPAAASANISTQAAKALRDHLKTCSILPQSVSSTDPVKIVMRVSFLRDGKLAKEPQLIEASASEKGPALMKSATDALLACQPYTVLPADKYDEWRMLDLSFTPKDFRG